MIRMYSGRILDPWTLKPGDLTARDVGHHLSMLCRYAGAVRSFYSVAEHCIIVSRLVGLQMIGASTSESKGARRRALQAVLWAQIHDAGEAVFVDVPRDVKHAQGMERYRDGEREATRSFAVSLGLPPEPPPIVDKIDKELVATEKAQLLYRPELPDDGLLEEPIIRGLVLGCMPPAEAETAWLSRFQELLRAYRSEEPAL